MLSISRMSVISGLVLVLGGGGVARGQGEVRRTLFLSESSAELGLGATVVGSGSGLSSTFTGAVMTLQGSYFRPLGVVFQMGVGAALDDDPVDAGKTRVAEQGWVGLGARFRPLALRGATTCPFELYVGPLLGTLFNPDVVIFAAEVEAGVAYRRGRLRLSLSLHGGWADVLHQALPKGMKASWSAGGLLSAGLAL